MSRELGRGLILAAALSLLGTVTALAVPQTVGLFLNTPAAYEGYTLFAPRDGPKTYLIDRDGNLVSFQRCQRSDPSARAVLCSY